MAFQVTPETDVAEAAMFHGARVNLNGGNFSLSTSNQRIQFDLVEFDTDGFWSSGSYKFVIPEGVSCVEVGGCISCFGTTTSTIEAFILASGGDRGSVRVVQGNAESGGVVGRLSIPLATGPLSTVTGESFELRARVATGTQTLQANNGAYPNYFWIRLHKTPFGRPDSPTLP